MKPQTVLMVTLLVLGSSSISLHGHAEPTQPVEHECDTNQCDIEVKAVVSGNTCNVKVNWERLKIKQGNHGASGNGVLLRWELDSQAKRDGWFFYGVLSAPVTLPSTAQFFGHENRVRAYHVWDFNRDQNDYSYTVTLRSFTTFPFYCVSDPTIANQG